MNKNFLIIGAGLGQVPAIEAAKALGLFTIVIDKNPTAIGMKLADTALQVDIVNIDKAVSVAHQYNVSGTMTIQSDIGVPTAGAIVDNLGLPGNGLAIANRCSNKIETRFRLQEFGVPQPRFRIVSDLKETWASVQKIGLPCVVKAPDSSGSRGVTRVNSLDDTKSAFAEAKKYSRDGRILVEEFIPGIEIGAQAFSVNGICEKVLVHNDTLSPPPYMIPTGHSFPSDLPTEKMKIVQAACAASVEALGIQSGPSNIDLILTADNEPRIIEIGARIGATCLPELVEIHTGIQWVHESIRACLGEAVNLESKVDRATAALILESPGDGIFTGYTAPPGIDDDKEVVKWEVTVEPGEEVNVLRKGTDRIGKIVTVADTLKAAESKAIEMKRRFEFRIQ